MTRGAAGSAWVDQLVADVSAARTQITTTGVVREAFGTLVRAAGVDAGIGDLCELREPGVDAPVLAEVIGLVGQDLILMPYRALHHLSARTEVVRVGRSLDVEVGDAMLGRVVNAFGQPLDGFGPVRGEARVPVYRAPPEAMSRQLIRTPLTTGIAAIDALNTLGEGQRVGVFAPAGVGKSTLLAMLARGAETDCSVIALVGERGREVREFVEHTLGPEGLRHACVIVATSDAPAAERLRAAYVATAIAEHFRDQGRRVTLFIDSLTRFARAQREVGLASGEPPTRQGFPPSVFTVLPRLLERAGPGEHGSITAFYTVLTDDEDANDPVAEEVRSILDGHLVLSRKLAEKAHFPAIDPLASLSRLMSAVAEPDHRQQSARIRELIAKYRDIELLVQLGEYQAGSDAVADAAIAQWDPINRLLQQRSDEHRSFDDVRHVLSNIAAASQGYG